MSEIKLMDLTEFRNLGFLQEVNRLFFHPRGLALEVICEGEGTGQDLTVTGLGGIWDYREDPEGMAFGDGPNQEKVDQVQEEYDSHIAERLLRFGWVIQPPGVPVPYGSGDSLVEDVES